MAMLGLVQPTMAPHYHTHLMSWSYIKYIITLCLSDANHHPLACFVLRCIWIYKQPVRTDKNTNMELIYTSTTVITNIFCTTSIIYQLLSIGGWRKSLRTYRGLIEILVESSILHTVVYLVRVALEIHAQYFAEVLDARHWYPQALGYSITVRKSL